MLHTKLSFRNYDYIPKLSSYGQGQGHRNKRLPHNVCVCVCVCVCVLLLLLLFFLFVFFVCFFFFFFFFFIFKVICLICCDIVIALVFINIIKCSLNTNTFLLQKCFQDQG